MSVRITGGALRGRVLGRVPPGVRPTAGRVREALFSMLGQDLAGWSVLDAFGGTGLLGFEAASRGAAPVTIVERHRDTARRIQENAAALGLGPPDLLVRQGDARRVLAEGRWDLVLLDPPYAEDPLVWIALAAPAVRGLLVVEHRAAALPAQVEGLVLERARDYGDTTLSLYRPSRATDPSGPAEVG